MILTVDKLEQKLKSEDLDKIYLFYGEEIYLLEMCLKKIKNLFGELMQGINYIAIDETNADSFIQNVETASFGYEKKLIVVRNANLFKKEDKKKAHKTEDIKQKISSYLENNIEEVKDSNIIVFVEQEVNKTEFFDFVEKEGVVCNFEKLKQVELQKRLKAIVSAYKVQADDATLKFFIETVGTSMQDLINEIRKLIEYKGSNGRILKEDIEKLSIKNTEAVIFDLTDNLGNKDIKKAFEILNNLLYNKEPIQMILIMLYNHFKKLYLTKLSEKYSKDMAGSLKLRPNQMFLISKYKKQASYFQEIELRNILRELTKLDANYKVGLIDLQIGLEAILCNYCSK